MKKDYCNPEIEVIEFANTDVLSGSNQGEWDILKSTNGNIFNR